MLPRPHQEPHAAGSRKVSLRYRAQRPATEQEARETHRRHPLHAEIIRHDLRSGWTQKQRELYGHQRFPCYVYPWITCVHLGDPRYPELPNLDPVESDAQRAERRRRHQALLLDPEPARDWDAAKEAIAPMTQPKRSRRRSRESVDGPLVSVILNSYNHERYLEECIESVLAQTYRHFELIIIDDASTDGSPEIIKGYAARFPERLSTVLRDDNWGVCRSYNQGLDLASGIILSSISSDDVWLPDGLEKRVGFFGEHPDIDQLVTDFDVIDAEGVIHTGDAKLQICPQFKPFFESDLEHLSVGLYERLLLGNFLPDPAIHTSLSRISKEEARLDEHCPEVSDWDQNLRLTRSYRWAYLPESTVRYRWHGENLSWPRESLEGIGSVIAQRLYVLGKELADARTLDHRRVILQQIGTLWRRYSVLLPET